MRLLVASAILALGLGAAAAPLDLGQIDGVYKHRFADALVSGEHYTGEDILEIVKVSPRAAYIRTHLDFYNGHICALNGIALVEGDSLIYREPPGTAGAGQCRLRIQVTRDKLVFDDGDRSCQDYCGMRGAFNGTGFAREARRPIRYMPRLMNSTEYKSAMAAFDPKR